MPIKNSNTRGLTEIEIDVFRVFDEMKYKNFPKNINIIESIISVSTKYSILTDLAPSAKPK